MVSEDGALVLLSGGQDSATCLAWALDQYSVVETVGYDYGQRHRVELDCRAMIRRRLASLQPAWAKRLGDDHTINLPALGEISDTALTRDVYPVHARIRKSLGEMTRKLSDTASQ